MELNNKYWDKRYAEGSDKWDCGVITTPIKDYIDQLENPFLRILVVGCGNGHELEYIFEAGFDNVYGVDFSELAISNFSSRVPDFPKENLICADFFELEGEFDLIIEQTFFCALHPDLRENYAKQMSSLLAENGKLVGVLFSDKMNGDGPPFGGSSLEYLGLFSPYFSNLYMKPCFNSIQPRLGREIFINFSK